MLKMLQLLYIVCLVFASEVHAEETTPTDLDRIETLENVVMQQAEQIQELQAEVSELMESKLFGYSSRKKMLQYHDKCAFSSHGFCFFGYFQRDGLNQDGARLACEQRGAQLANIYSEDHYYQAMDYLRLFLPALIDTTGYVITRTGMTFQTTTGIVYLSNGNEAPFVMWRPGNPYFKSGYDDLLLAVKTVQDSQNGMYNYATSLAADAVLCQIPI